MAILGGDPATATQITDELGTSLGDTQNTDGTTTSTTYTSTLTGGTACGFSFVAPPSGKVRIYNNCELNNSGGFSLCTIRVRTGGTVGSGSDVVAASDNNTLFHNTNIRLGISVLVTGLAAGSTY